MVSLDRFARWFRRMVSLAMVPLKIFHDRESAGIELGAALAKRHLAAPVMVLGLPRGGVPVAFHVARALHAPLDVFLVRKIGMPGQPEFAIGAIAMGDILVWHPHFADSAPAMARTVQAERTELERRERTYRSGRPPLDLKGQTVVLVDDGLATGLTMVAAVRGAIRAGAAHTIAAAPVASPDAAALIQREGAEVVVLQTPRGLSSIGEWYEHFEQLDDAEVLRFLNPRPPEAQSV